MLCSRDSVNSNCAGKCILCVLRCVRLLCTNIVIILCTGECMLCVRDNVNGRVINTIKTIDINIIYE